MRKTVQTRSTATRPARAAPPPRLKAAGTGGEDATPGGVAAVERALSILTAFREGDQGLSLAVLAERTGFYKSTILRLIASLERRGFLRRMPDGNYQLGPMTFRLGNLYQDSFRLEEFVMPVLRELVRRTSESASFYVTADKSRLCLYRVDSTQAIRDHVKPGDMLPLNRGAAGHILTTFGDGLRKGRERPANAFVRATFGERQADTAAVAAPVFGVDGRLVGAVSVSGPKTRFTKSAVSSIGAAVLDAARTLTTHLGGDALAYPQAASF